jgi:hypothetical protein
MFPPVRWSTRRKLVYEANYKFPKLIKLPIIGEYLKKYEVERRPKLIKYLVLQYYDIFKFKWIDVPEVHLYNIPETINT